ncbi:protein kinase domain-containing protein [Streptomyces physcomitrii]|uniref:serine/threonine-protein kinase n=1 Tax=Streptomyces physcomitrii TaxID=2724184 RepID=UPI003F4CF75D
MAGVLGRLVGGRYRVVGRIGSGGMGTVWRALDERVGHEVALKQPRLPGDPQEEAHRRMSARLHREARAAARVDHPCAVSVHDVVVEDGLPWIVMELVRGESLQERLDRGPLAVPEAARVGLALAGALGAAHAKGIVHRDVKPANVLLGSHDRVVLTDFGIAQIRGEESLTVTGEFVGSLEYVAPERIAGHRAGPASDLWSLGVLLYAATEGFSPFRRHAVEAVLAAVLGAEPPEPAASGRLAPLIRHLLAKDPEARPTTEETLRHLRSATAFEETGPVVLGAGPGVGVSSGSGGGEAGARGSGLRELGSQDPESSDRESSDQEAADPVSQDGGSEDHESQDRESQDPESQDQGSQDPESENSEPQGPESQDPRTEDPGPANSEPRGPDSPEPEPEPVPASSPAPAPAPSPSRLDHRWVRIAALAALLGLALGAGIWGTRAGRDGDGGRADGPDRSPTASVELPEPTWSRRRLPHLGASLKLPETAERRDGNGGGFVREPGEADFLEYAVGDTRVRLTLYPKGTYGKSGPCGDPAKVPVEEWTTPETKCGEGTLDGRRTSLAESAYEDLEKRRALQLFVYDEDGTCHALLVDMLDEGRSRAEGRALYRDIVAGLRLEPVEAG